MNPHFLSLPSQASKLPAKPHSLATYCKRSRVRGLPPLTWALPPGKPEKADFCCLFSLPSLWSKQMNLGPTDRDQLLYSLRKHGHCHLHWETLSGSNLHTVSLVFIHLSQACQHYAFIWPMRSPHSWKEKKTDAWLPNCSNYLKTFLMLATSTAYIIQPP